MLWTREAPDEFIPVRRVEYKVPVLALTASLDEVSDADGAVVDDEAVRVGAKTLDEVVVITVKEQSVSSLSFKFCF